MSRILLHVANEGMGEAQVQVFDDEDNPLGDIDVYPSKEKALAVLNGDEQFNGFPIEIELGPAEQSDATIEAPSADAGAEG